MSDLPRIITDYLPTDIWTRRDIDHRGIAIHFISANLKVSSLIVDRRNKDDAYGLVTKTDIVKKVIDAGPKRKNLSNAKVFQIMSKPVITVSPGLAIKYCGRVMNKSGVSRVPVFDGKQIVGILSMSDIFNHS